jgi:hypothetical protein
MNLTILEDYRLVTSRRPCQASQACSSRTRTVSGPRTVFEVYQPFFQRQSPQCAFEKNNWVKVCLIETVNTKTNSTLQDCRLFMLKTRSSGNSSISRSTSSEKIKKLEEDMWQSFSRSHEHLASTHKIWRIDKPMHRTRLEGLASVLQLDDF